MFDDVNRMFEGIDNHIAKLRAEFERLSCDPPCLEEVEIGTHVLVHAGLLGMGHDWIRLEAEVTKIASTAYYVRFTERKKFGTQEPQEMWIHRFLVTDIVK